jgi:hypothetical protein
MEKAIEVKGLRKSFKDTEVLKGLRFSPYSAPTVRVKPRPSTSFRHF